MGSGKVDTFGTLSAAVLLEDLPIREAVFVTLPWIVALAALLYLVLWQSGLLQADRQARKDRPPRQLKGRADPNRLKVFEDFLRNLQPDKEDDSSAGDPPKTAG